MEVEDDAWPDSYTRLEVSKQSVTSNRCVDDRVRESLLGVKTKPRSRRSVCPID